MKLPARPSSATFAGALVVLTACLVTVGLGATTCALYLRGDLEAAGDAALQASSALAVTVALLSRTRPDPEPTPAEPMPVYAPEPLEVTGPDGYPPALL